MLLDEHSKINNSSSFENIGKGIWFFILIDFIIFALLFAYRYSSGADFSVEYASARSQLLLSFGFVNTIVILTSGFSIGISKVAFINKNRFLSLLFLYVTLFLGILFVANRLIDCSYLADKGFLLFSDAFNELPKELALFFKTYFYIYFFFMIHLFVGILLLIRTIWGMTKNNNSTKNFSRLNLIVIYWNYLTLVWMVAFPILFLI